MALNRIARGSLILTDEGWLPVEHLRQVAKRRGKYKKIVHVTSYDPFKRKSITQPVKFIARYKRTSVIIILANGAFIELDKESGLFVKDRGFIQIQFIDKYKDRLLYMYPNGKKIFSNIKRIDFHSKKRMFVIFSSKRPRTAWVNGFLFLCNYRHKTDLHENIRYKYYGAL